MLISHEFWQQNSLYSTEQCFKKIHQFFLKKQKMFSSWGLPYDSGAGSKQTGGVGCYSSEAQMCSQHWQIVVSLTDSYTEGFLEHLLFLPSPWTVHEIIDMTKRSRYSSRGWINSWLHCRREYFPSFKWGWNLAHWSETQINVLNRYIFSHRSKTSPGMQKADSTLSIFCKVFLVCMCVREGEICNDFILYKIKILFFKVWENLRLSQIS